VHSVILGGVLDKAFGGEAAIANWARFVNSQIAPSPGPPPKIELPFLPDNQKIEFKNFDPAKGLVVGMDSQIQKEKVDGNQKHR